MNNSTSGVVKGRHIKYQKVKKAIPSFEKAIDVGGGFTCVCFHVCKCICMCKCVYVCLETLGVVSQVFSILFFEMRFLIGLVFTNQARLAGSGLQGFTCLYLSVVGRKMYTPACPSFYVGPGARTQVLVFAG